MAKTQTDITATRHSLAHIMATAIQELYPEAKFGVGPVVENGFYYDVDVAPSLTPEDLPKIEAKMHEIIKADYPFERSTMPIEEAIKYFEGKNQPYKVELLHDLQQHGTTMAKDIDHVQLGVEGGAKVVEVGIYTDGPFTDLCRGPHVASTGQVGAFKLLRLSGAYWRGNEKNPQLQRIYGVGFTTEIEIKDYLERLAEAEKRDHRKLGLELGIYMNSDLVGAGLPLLMPNGETIKHELIEYMRQKEQLLGYQYVSTPILAHEGLYQASGHAEFYADDMYSLIDEEGNKFYIKPMNCPHHHVIYGRMVQSYRDLPLKLAENTGLYRHELSGTLSGLIRVRGPISQNDAHIYVAPNTLKAEFVKVLDLFKEVYADLGITGYWFRLSLPDFSSNKYGGKQEIWDEASRVIREALDESQVEYVEAAGEAAFYGPKLDVQIKNVTGKEDTIATSQVDILVPERMGLTYIDAEGNEQTPIVIHRSILGSYERFMAFLIEQTGGAFPVWLAPEQVRIATVNDTSEVVKWAETTARQMRAAGLRVELDADNESVGKKIRTAELAKVPYTIVVGEKEVETGQVAPRVRKDLGEAKEQPVEVFIKELAETIGRRSV